MSESAILSALTDERNAWKAKSDTLEAELVKERARVTELHAEVAGLRDEITRRVPVAVVKELEREIQRLKGGGQVEPGGAEPCHAGINLESNTDYASDAAFVNCFHRFSGWGMPDKPSTPNPALKLTADGMPTTDAGTFSYMLGYPGGPDKAYKLRFEGSGTPKVKGKGGKLTMVVRGAGVTTGELTFDPAAVGTLEFSLTGIDPADPPRNLTLTPPGCDPAKVFTPWFVERIKNFSTVRFMDWPRANTNDAVTWDQRTKPTDFLQTGPRGVAYEFMAALGAEAGVDVWVCTPFKADEDYLRQMARLFRDRIPAGRKVYAEAANEWFNLRTAAGQYLLDYAARMPQMGDANVARWKLLAMHVYIMALAWRGEWAGRLNDLRIVYAGHANDSGWLRVGLEYYAATFGPPARDIYALSVAGYHDVKPPVRTTGGTIAVAGTDDLLNKLAAEGKDAEALDLLFADLDASLSEVPRPRFTKHLPLVEKYGIKGGLVGYEIGRHLLQTQPGDGRIKRLAWGDPRMREITPRIFGNWKQNGGSGPACWYTLTDRQHPDKPDKFGDWGVLKDINDTDSPSWLGAVEYANANR